MENRLGIKYERDDKDFAAKMNKHLKELLNGGKMFLLKLGRELRNREVQIFLFALTLGTAAITAPSLLAERLNTGVQIYSEDILGADARLSSPNPLDEKWLERAQGLDLSRLLSFASIVVNPQNANFQLARINVVEDNYPLKGKLIATLTPAQDDREYSPPAEGEIWLDENLALLLGVEPGDKLSLGETDLDFAKYLIAQPGPASFFSFAPQAMINFADLDKTELVLPGSRLRYRYLWTGDENTLNTFLDELSVELQPNQRLLRVNDENSNFTDVLRRLRAFLLLSGSLCIFLSSFALLLSIRHFIDRNRRYVALLKTIGYSPTQTMIYLCKRIAPTAFLAYLLGCLGGWLGYSIISFYLDPLLPDQTEEGLFLMPFAISAVSTIICLFFFALPGLWQLAHYSPLALLRPVQDKIGMNQTLTALISCLGIFGLLLFYSNDWVISSGLFGTVIALILIMGLAGYGIMKLAHDKLINRPIPISAKLALISLFRQWPINSFQILSFSTAFMLIGILTIMRISFISDWQSNVKPDTPNYFLVNIGPDQLQPVRDLLRDNDIQEGIFSGMVRGKLTKVDGEDLIERTRRLGTYSDEAEREFNLGWSRDFPDHNQLIEGEWWTSQAEIRQDTFSVSLEEEIAEDFGVELGMAMEFVIGGRTLYGVARSIRRVDWSDFNPNFYVLFPDDALTDFPRTYMTSFYIPEDKKGVLKLLVDEFPTFSIISVDRILVQLSEIFALVSNAMQLILLLSLLAAVAVFIAAVQVSVDMRARTTSILRLIGETGRQAMTHNLLEFSFIGFLAGVLAVLGSELIVWIVYEFLLEQVFAPHYYFWILCPLFSTLLAATVGMLWARRMINIPPRDTIRSLMS